MKIIDQHIEEYLYGFINNPNQGFSEIYNDIQHPRKETTRDLLIYVDRIVDRILSNSSNQLQFEHLHFACDEERIKIIIAEYLVIKFFRWGMMKDLQNDCKSDSLKKLYEQYKEVRKGFKIVPYYVSSKNPAKGREWEAENKKTKKIFKFFSSLYNYLPNQTETNLSLCPYVLLNLQKKLFNELIPTLETRPYAIPVLNLKSEMRSYVVQNTSNFRDEIDQIEIEPKVPLMDCIEHIILLDCEQKSIFREYNFRALNEWNNNGSSFRSIFLISFGEDQPRFQWLRSHFERINSRYYKETKDKIKRSHLITSGEIKTLLKKSKRNEIDVELWGDTRCSYWDEFLFRINQYEGLYELRSLKMKNLYSLVLNDKSRRIILYDIFSSDSPGLISVETYETLKEIPTAILNEIKSNLELTLDWIIDSGWPEYLRSQITSNALLLLPSQLKIDNLLMKALVDSLPINGLRQVSTLFDVDPSIQKEVIVLDYRDPGYFPYIITPNVFEANFPDSPRARGIFLGLMFSDKYKWTLYNMSKDLMRLMQSQQRVEHFAWNELYNKVQSIRPENREDLNWDLESSYQNLQECLSININISFSKGKDKSYSTSEPLIAAIDDIGQLRVKRANDLLAEDLDEVVLYIQGLDEVYAGLNLYEKLANTKREETELKIIRKQYQLEESETADRLWKELLHRKVKEKGTLALYYELETFFKNQGLSIVSSHTFRTTWTNPNSESLIPREKKMFLKVCEYLGLPISYVRIMLRMKNAERQATMNSSKQMNNLLLDLFNDGCFDNDANIEEKITRKLKTYVDTHDFDEIGIGKEYVVSELTTLVKLLKPNIQLKKVTRLEKN